MEYSKDIDTKKSKLLLEGSAKEQENFEKRVISNLAQASSDQSDRKRMYDKRRNFLNGDHDKYTNIFGLTKRQKKGHADQTINYAGRSTMKIYHTIANNPPNINMIPLDVTDEEESLNTQMVEDFVDRVFWFNKWWKQGYKRATMNQVSLGDFAVKVYFDSDKREIKLTHAEKMENIYVGWRSDDALDYDWVAHIEKVSVQWIRDNWGIEAEAEETPTGNEVPGMHGDEWGQSSGPSNAGRSDKTTPTQPMAEVIEFTTDKWYAILVNKKIVQLVEHQYGFNPWVIGHSFHVPGKPWSKAFIDDLMSPNVELNEVMNDVRDFIRTASNAKYVARNMSDFDPESIKTGSGQVVFVDGPDSDFTTLDQRVNTYPADTYVQKIISFIHDMGIPAVAFGSGGGDSGRSKAIDYQSVVDFTDDLRDAWELVLDGVMERIQKLGSKYFEAPYWLNSEGQFETRQVEYDWNDVLPITQSDKIVDVLNKFQMGLPFRLVYKELGYKDVDAVIELMRKESLDAELTTYRAKMYQYMKGAVEAQQEATAAMQPPQQQMGGQTPASPVLNSSQNAGRESSLPMSARGGSVSFTSPLGFIDQTKQNLAAQGR